MGTVARRGRHRRNAWRCPTGTRLPITEIAMENRDWMHASNADYFGHTNRVDCDGKKYLVAQAVCGVVILAGVSLITTALTLGAVALIWMP